MGVGGNQQDCTWEETEGGTEMCGYDQTTLYTCMKVSKVNQTILLKKKEKVGPK